MLINKSDQNKLFEKFTRARRAISENPQVSGLGFFIAKKIVEAHKGKIELSSEGYGKGTEARVWLGRG